MVAKLGDQRGTEGSGALAAAMHRATWRPVKLHVEASEVICRVLLAQSGWPGSGHRQRSEPRSGVNMVATGFTVACGRMVGVHKLPPGNTHGVGKI